MSSTVFAIACEAHEYSGELLDVVPLESSCCGARLSIPSTEAPGLYVLFFQARIPPQDTSLCSVVVLSTYDGPKKPTIFGVFIGMPKRTIPGVVILIRWWSGPPVAVLLPPGSEPAIQLTTEKASGALETYAPRGPVVIRPLTATERQFLKKQGMNPELFKAARVYGVSDEIASRFDEDRKAGADLAKQIGLDKDDLWRILKAKKQLAMFQPKNLSERKALQALQQLFTLPAKKQRGRPSTVTAEERIQLHEDAEKLRSEGKDRNEIIRILSQRYEIRYSYAKRILEDRL